MNRHRICRIELLESRQLLTGTISEQIIVDQFGWRADAPRKVALFADPINGQNAAIAYTPSAQFQVRRVSDDGIAFTGSTVSWKAGQTDAVSGDKVWSGDFSSLTTSGEYYIYDPGTNLRSYAFKVDNNLFNNVLKTSVRTFYYQRTGTAIPAQFGGNWVHAIDHVGPNQDTQARQWQAGVGAVPGSPARDVSGGWFDAGDYNKYVPFTTNVLWNLLNGYEWNPSAFGDNWNVPESGNGTPDVLDEVKYELEWLRKMQLSDGSVMNRVANATYNAGNFDPSTDTQPRYYTAATTWATASFAASLAHAARVFSPFDAAYSATLLAAAQNAWTYLQSHTSMLPASGTDGGGSGGSNGGLAAAGGDANAGMDFRLRVLAAAELWKTTGTAAYKTYFETNYKNSAGSDNGNHPLLGGWPHFDTTLATELNRAYVTYATTPGANASIVNEIKQSLGNMVEGQIVPAYNNADDPYRAFMWDGHYFWGSNQVKNEWANLLLYAIKLNTNPANSPKYREMAEEYVHYFHGRNPLSEVYLSNMGTKGANLGADKSVMQPYHSWFGDGSPKYDGESSQFGPVPGYLVGGPNRYFGLNWIAPPYGEPPMKAFKDWNTGWNAQRQANENSWEITEPAIYYQAAYTLLLSQFATQETVTPPPAVSGVFVGSTGWSPSFLNFLASTSVGDATYGYAIDPADQLNELPWTNLNKVSVRFTRNVNVAQGNLSITGVNVANYAVGAFAYDAGTFTATWTLDTAGVGPEKMQLNLSGVTDAVSGAALDGEWPGTTANAFPSGNGNPGGNFVFQMNVLPGDVNRSGGSVTGSDVTLTRNAQNFSPGSSGYDIFKDVNGTASILGSDVTLVRNRQGLSLPAGSPSVVLQNTWVTAGRPTPLVNTKARPVAVELLEFPRLSIALLDPHDPRSSQR